MILLAIDTTSEHGSLALLNGGALLEELPIEAPNGFGHILFGEIRELLRRHSMDVHDVECFATATGPGSFTGVRIGLTAAKALAESCGRPVAGVSNLRALAAYGETHRRAVLLDARRSDIYGAVYDEAGRVIGAEVVLPFDAWLASLPEDTAEFICQDFSPYVRTRFADLPVRKAPRALAAAIGAIAAAEGRLMMDPAALDANYVRRSDAELFWKEA